MPSNPAFSKIIAIATLLLAFIFTSVYAAPVAPDSAGAGSSATGNLPSVTVSSTYTLSPYDVIDVSVYGEEDLHTRARLGADGAVLLPLIGNVPLSGKTVSEANESIKKRYADGGFVKDPHVLLTVVEYRKSTFSILGQVSRAGIYEIPEGTHMSIVDAILVAGGFTHVANKNGVLVKRVIKGKAVVYKVKAGAMAESAEIAPFDIRAGDVITVKESIW